LARRRWRAIRSLPEFSVEAPNAINLLWRRRSAAGFKYETVRRLPQQNRRLSFRDDKQIKVTSFRTKDFWDRLIRRSATLASEQPATRELLLFYGKLLGAQKEIYDQFGRKADWLPSGDFGQDVEAVSSFLPLLLRVVQENGPELLSQQAQEIHNWNPEEIRAMLTEYWDHPTGTEFFAKALLQPYGRWMVETGARPAGKSLGSVENRCPFCDGKPQLSFMFSNEQEGGGRSLLCAACLSEWTFRRVVCAGCLEEHPSKLGYFSSPDIKHMRVEVCETCRTYTKGVDLTVLGRAVPLVDEVAGAALDLWARERGYEKIELNLVGV